MSMSSQPGHHIAQVAAHDASHDMTHIERVARMAQTLAVAEGLPRDQQNLVRLSALMHDVDDYKYSGDEGATEATVTVRQRPARDHD